MGNENCMRMQLPLSLSYAITAHKVQGMTIATLIMRICGWKKAGKDILGSLREPERMNEELKRYEYGARIPP